MIKMNKVALMVALLLSAAYVEAKPLGSSSSRPSSASVGVSRSPPPRPSYTPPQPRPTTQPAYVPAVPQQQPAYTPSRTRSSSVDCNQSYNYNAPECYNRRNGSSNTGNVVAAGLAGAALGAGAMAIANSGSEHNIATTATTPPPTYQPQQLTQYQPSDSKHYESSNGGGGSFFGSLFEMLAVLVLLGIVGYAIYKYKTSKREGYGVGTLVDDAKNDFKSATTSKKDELYDKKEMLFVDFQQNNRKSGLEYIKANTTPFMFQSLKPLIEEQDDGRTVEVLSVRAEIVSYEKEGSQQLATVNYKATINEKMVDWSSESTDIDQNWNFVYNGSWKLEGIN